MNARLKPTIIDRAVAAVLPVQALKRQVARVQSAQLEQLTANASPTTPQRSETRWRGASQTLRSLVGWVTNMASGRVDNSKPERERAAARSFDAWRNHMLARAAVTRLRTNVVGTGLQMHPTVDAAALAITEDQAAELNELIAREWALYYDNPVEVDLDATLDGAGLQALNFLTAMLAGDCFALTPFEEREGCIYGLKIQTIDPARVNNPNNAPDSAGLQDGVYLSPTGMPIAISIQNRHPNDPLAGVMPGWQRRMIFDGGQRRIFQVWQDKDRIGVTRGFPLLAPILEPLQQLEQYTRAELLAAVISSFFTVFLKKEKEQFDERGNPIPAIAGQTAPPGEEVQLAMGPGAVLELSPGEEPVFADPSRPSSKFDPFYTSIVTAMGAALELPIDELLLRYQSSYSAARAAMLQAWRIYSMRRWWLVQQFCQPHYVLWFDEAVRRGRLQVTDYTDPIRRAAYTQAIWIGPARGAMDEGQEATAAKTRIDAGISNETIETAQMMGENRNTVYQTRKREIEQRRRDGMELGPAPGQQEQPAPARPPGGGADEPPNPADDPPDDETPPPPKKKEQP